MANAGWSDGRRLVVGYVNGKVTSLQRRFLSSQGKSSAAADLARLRRSASKEPGVSPEVWGVEFDGMPESLIGSSPEPSLLYKFTNCPAFAHAAISSADKTILYIPLAITS